MAQIDSKAVNYEHVVEIKDNITIVKIPETYVDKPLTELQEETLLLFEKEFAGRYTDNDEDYVAFVKSGSSTPPLISSYWPRRDHRNDERSRAEKRRWDDRRNSNDNRHSHYSYNKQPRHDYNNYRR